MRCTRCCHNPCNRWERYEGIGFCGVLAIVFSILKLTGVLRWSWWWVLSPVWIPAGFMVLIVLLAIPLIYTRITRK
jgi:hypothetical protein